MKPSTSQIINPSAITGAMPIKKNLVVLAKSFDMPVSTAELAIQSIDKTVPLILIGNFFMEIFIDSIAATIYTLS